MPDKRQESKQRRAARNRANREALAARRDNAVASATSTSSTTSKASSGSSKTAAAKGAAASSGGTSRAAAAPPPSGIVGMLQSKRPGDKAVLAALALAVVASVYLLFYQVPADDRGEPLPAQFRGVAIEARERLTGEEMPDNTVSLLDASGPQIFLVLALPVAVTVFAVWANRRPDRSRMLTFAMLALAGSVILTGGIGIFYFPALIALAVGGFRVRKADLPARVAERTAPVGGRRGRGRGRVIDADSEEVTDGASTDPGESTSAWSRRRRRGATAPVDAAGSDLDESGVVDADVVDAGVDDADVDVAELADAELADAPDTEDAGDEVEYDPLAELEAELEAERATDQGSDDTGSGESGDNGRSRRRR